MYNHLLDTDFKDFMNLYKNCAEKPYSLLIIDAPLVSYNTSHLRKNLLERM